MSGRKRNIQVHFCMNEQEHEVFKKRVEESGLGTAQAYAIQALLTASVTSFEEVEALNQLNRELAKQSVIMRNLANNVNQTVRYCHQKKDMSLDEIRSIQEQVNQLQERMEEEWRHVRYVAMVAQQRH